MKEEVGKDSFDNPGEAAARAKEIGCTGIHSHDTPKGKVFMPCKTHSDYMNAIANDDDDEKYGKPHKKPKDKKTKKPKKAKEVSNSDTDDSTDAEAGSGQS